MEFISKELDRYCTSHTSAECDVLNELNHETHTNILNPRMISGNLQGQFLTMLSRMMSPKCILEIGTYTGYSAICLAKGLPVDGVLHTIDRYRWHSSLLQHPSPTAISPQKRQRCAVI